MRLGDKSRLYLQKKNMYIPITKYNCWLSFLKDDSLKIIVNVNVNNPQLSTKLKTITNLHTTKIENNFVSNHLKTHDRRSTANDAASDCHTQRSALTDYYGVTNGPQLWWMMEII